MHYFYNDKEFLEKYKNELMGLLKSSRKEKNFEILIPFIYYPLIARIDEGSIKRPLTIALNKSMKEEECFLSMIKTLNLHK